MNWSNFHSHCFYCDGKFEPERYIQRAIDMNVFSFGFSSHAPLPFDCNWCMRSQDTLNYINEIQILKKRYADRIQVYIGMEVDYIPDVMSPTHPSVSNLDLDYTIGAIHFIEQDENGKPWEIDGNHNVFLNGLNTIFKNDIMAVIKRYFQLTRAMVREACPDIIGHLDKIKIQNRESKFYHEFNRWYQYEIMHTLEEIKASGAILEVNTRGIYKKKTVHTYPSQWILEKVKQMKIPITLSSDAHHPEEIINCFERAAYMLRELGFKFVRVLINGEWTDVELDLRGLKISQYA